MTDLLAITDETHTTCHESYRRIAEKLMNSYKLRVRSSFYRIVECEFYYNSDKHQDPYVHGHEWQKKSIGEWYFHGSGLDITISNGQAYGGILIRGIARITGEANAPRREDAIIGPLNVCTEIFKQIGPVLANGPLDFGLVDISQDPMEARMKSAKIFTVPRIGLNNTKDNEGAYWKKPYRFISFLHLPHREADKIKKYLVDETGALTPTEYKEFYSGKKW